MPDRWTIVGRLSGAMTISTRRLMWTGLIGFAIGLAMQPPASAEQIGINPAEDKVPAGKVEIVDMGAQRLGALTCFRVLSLGQIKAQVYPVDGPPRVVIDAAGAEFRLQMAPKRAAVGLASTFRFGRIGGGRARIVIDAGPGTLIGKVSNRALDADLFELLIPLSIGVAVAEDDACQRPDGAGQIAAAETGGLTNAASGERRRRGARRDKPIVIIDPGHGGIDPGAVVGGLHLEKAIVLAVGKRLARLLEETGRFRIVMTRDRDAFVALDERIERARAVKGDLFISLHADAIDDDVAAATAKGAAVYILSHRASDAEAKRLADKENAADLLAGILPKQVSDAEGVRTILVELLARETERESARLRGLLVDAMRSKVLVAREPARSAAFHVLKQTETPAALVELGYMTNARDLERMRKSDWQEQIASAMAQAIGRFFAPRPAVQSR